MRIRWDPQLLHCVHPALLHMQASLDVPSASFWSYWNCAITTNIIYPTFGEECHKYHKLVQIYAAFKVLA